MTDWLDRVAADLLTVEHDVRSALRALARGQPHPRLRPLEWDSLTLRAHEARALLRGAMPVPVALSTLRGQHARLSAALGLFAAHLVALNDPLHDQHSAAAAAHVLLEELREWLRQAEWRRAARAARVRWPCPQPAIRRVMQLEVAEHPVNAAAGRARRPAAALHLLRHLAADRQLDLTLPAPLSAIDPRQLHLQLAA